MKSTTIPQPVRDILVAQGERITLNAGEHLFCKGDSSAAIYLVEQGSLKVHLGGEDSKDDDIMLNLIMPGELTGEIGAITGWPRTATLTAEQNATLIRIALPTLRRLLHEVPDLAAIMMETAGRHLMIADADRISLGRSYRQMHKRILDLDEEQAQLHEIMTMRREMESMIVHDLRNPLSSIQAGLDILALLEPEEACDPRFTSTHHLIAQAVARMRMLVDTMLDIAKMEAGHSILNLSTFDLSALLTAILAEQRPLAEEHHITLEAQLPATYHLQADREVLYRVFTNLIDNALKFTPANGRVRLDIELRGENWTFVKISDTGPGIPPEERARIFEKFTQLKNIPPRDARHGTGLGLTFCQMAVEAHGGQIWVEDGPNGTGATFVCRLPRTPEMGS